MATLHAASGELIDLRPCARIGHASELPQHKVASAITIQCLEVKVEVVAHGRSQAMPAQTMMFLSGGEPHAVRALEDSSILVTLLVNRV